MIITLKSVSFARIHIIFVWVQASYKDLEKRLELSALGALRAQELYTC